MSDYIKTNWQDGENKYAIKDQADNIIHDDIKLVYKGTGGTPLSSANMNKIENAMESVFNKIQVCEFIKSFPVLSGNSVSIGDVVEFTSSGIKKMQSVIEGIISATLSSTVGHGNVVKLNGTQSVITHKGGTTVYLKAQVLDHEKYELGTAVNVTNDQSSGKASLDKLTDSKLFIAYPKGSTFNGYFKILTVSGLVITPATEYSIPHSRQISDVYGAKALSDSKVVIVFRDSNNTLYANIVTINTDNTGTFGTEVYLGYLLQSGRDPIINIFDNGTVCITCCYENGNANIILYTVNGNNLTQVDSKTLGNPMYYNKDSVNIGSNKNITIYNNSTDNKVYYIFSTIVNNVITVGTPKELIGIGSSVYDIEIVKYSDNRLVMFYTNSSIGKCIPLYVNTEAETLTIGLGYNFISENCDKKKSAMLDENRSIVIFESNSVNEKYAVISNNIDSVSPIAISKEAKAGGEDCNVSLGPVYCGMSGLEIGSKYYAQYDGTIGKTKTSKLIGVAVSDTEICKTM